VCVALYSTSTRGYCSPYAPRPVTAPLRIHVICARQRRRFRSLSGCGRGMQYGISSSTGTRLQIESSPKPTPVGVAGKSWGSRHEIQAAHRAVWRLTPSHVIGEAIPLLLGSGSHR
jgi:hypothetical protein